VVGEIVVVFDWFKGRGLAEETEVVDWDGGGEEGLYCWGWLVGGMEDSNGGRGEGRARRGRGGRPSNMPNPDLRIGTREIVSGEMVVVVYSQPRWVLHC
jgi:hypothetical protein